ncbi:MAG: DUF2199 domain-containing protein [Gammaproteobacteria bacterium]
MGAIFAFKCSCCGELHEGSPSFAFNAPDQYASLSKEQKGHTTSGSGLAKQHSPSVQIDRLACR